MGLFGLVGVRRRKSSRRPRTDSSITIRSPPWQLRAATRTRDLPPQNPPTQPEPESGLRSNIAFEEIAWTSAWSSCPNSP